MHFFLVGYLIWLFIEAYWVYIIIFFAFIILKAIIKTASKTDEQVQADKVDRQVEEKSTRRNRGRNAAIGAGVIGVGLAIQHKRGQDEVEDFRERFKGYFNQDENK